MGKLIPIATLTFILVFSSCKKDSDVGTPTASVLAPPSGTTYNVFDTIQIKAQVSDQANLQSVSLYITNYQNTPVLNSVAIPITGKTMTFSCPYPINDIHLPSGQYTIDVRASNGTNVGWGFQQIYINAVPTVLMGVYAITRNTSGVHLMKIDTSYNVSTVYSQGGDYSSSDISSYYQQMYISAADSGNAIALNLPGASPAWTINGITSPTPYFTNTYSYGNAVYVSQYNGLIKYLSSTGMGNVTIPGTSGYYPKKTLQWNSYLFAEQKCISSSSINLVSYYAASGAGYEQIALAGPLVAMYGQDINDIFVFGNLTSGGAYLEQYNALGNTLYSPITMPAGTLLSVAQIDNQTYLLGFDNSTIYEFTYNPLGLVPFINGVSASHLQYDAVDGQVFASSGKYIYQYNFNTAALVHTSNMQDSVLNMHLLYNK